MLLQKSVAVHAVVAAFINQSLRNTKFPYDNWRTADPGHIHYKCRLNDDDSWHWFR